ncbi:MAG: DNRLRE domain-containing protein [Phycisphaerae bacterium]|nr:DNRLRE domain-containing protein [Phycisphaerae bacterium]
MNKLTTILMSVAMVALLVSSAQADTVTLQNGLDGYAGTEDTVLFSVDARNFGGHPDLEVKEYNGSGHGLIRFDLSSLNIANLEITSATLSMYSRNAGGSGPYTTSIYEIAAANADWGEGNSVGYEIGSATWGYEKYNTDVWAGSNGCSTSGTDYVATAMATETGALNTWSDFVISAAGLDVLEDWADGTKTNGGFVVLQDTANRLIFHSSEYGTASFRPKLTITYTPEPATMTLLLLGLPLALRRRRK